ncbi:hypothetical protein SEA_CHERRYONLIM_4 [Gordonia phage CherryonLim]|uniref:Putative regulatory protein FmdB zinc ribbon domain-containing protein n=1 Tax=Gordonia phage CherryonLim TaxID=2652411 RepID=A0A5P8D9U2_9CAUD|nr:hypothetical protein PP994_gp04 [Gordonia phage CherryonLim]QFP95757.1 hypothetical protein SEA_CHERRYONLIM_4 [Gordonia phage CherryonLim]
MPTYQYKCEQDGIMFELHQSIHDDPIEYCECGSRVCNSRLSGVEDEAWHQAALEYLKGR